MRTHRRVQARVCAEAKYGSVIETLWCRVDCSCRGDSSLRPISVLRLYCLYPDCTRQRVQVGKVLSHGHAELPTWHSTNESCVARTVEITFFMPSLRSRLADSREGPHLTRPSAGEARHHWCSACRRGHPRRVCHRHSPAPATPGSGRTGSGASAAEAACSLVCSAAHSPPSCSARECRPYPGSHPSSAAR